MGAFGPRKRAVFSCEACGAVLVKRTSYLTHKHLRHDLYVCTNPVCSASYSGHSELTGLTSPSGHPTARLIELPDTPEDRKKRDLRTHRESLTGGQIDLVDAIDCGDNLP